jgi:hypothetical protein
MVPDFSSQVRVDDTMFLRLFFGRFDKLSLRQQPDIDGEFNFCSIKEKIVQSKTSSLVKTVFPEIRSKNRYRNFCENFLWKKPFPETW